VRILYCVSICLYALTIRLRYPLHSAAHKGHIQVVRYFLDRNVKYDILLEHTHRTTTLLRTTHHIKLYTYPYRPSLICVDVQDKMGNTPLDLSVSAGHYEVAVALLTKEGSMSFFFFAY